MLSMN